ncbi:alkaline phosphatase family protein [Halostella sp. JP-L12]|uniref:alkaline phosphatase family protein n=1 Tax=Halostella TaxID=1843185 RepID=UPI000EF851D5|nr:MULTISPECIES: alkaline phosphatase family protein [Halostella]NHN49568.1 alkaline phosphatase family protein [Halostella sp. JP-L12]
MLRSDVEAHLRDEFEDDGYLFPDYEGYCFANVSHTATSLLGAETGRTLPEDVFDGVETDGVDTVLVVLIDGFGLQQWKRDRERHALLDRITERGVVTPLTSVYPSETAAAITTLHTGALPAEHGVVGWNVYEPTVDEEFEALPFLTKDGTPPTGLTRDDVANADPLYPELADAGIGARFVSPFADGVEGVEGYPYEDVVEVGDRLRDALVDTDGDGLSYVFTYLPQIDAASHADGTEAESYQETLASLCEQLERAVESVGDDTAEDALLVVTADHGHVDTDPARNVDLGGIDGLPDSLRQRADGTPIRFSGSPRNVHLQLRPDRVDAVADRLRGELDARVFTREEVLGRDLFGDVEPSGAFRRRLGDLVLTHRNLGTWWGDAEPGELELIGMHGGLHPHEMLVPFAAVRLSELRE